MRSYEDGDQNDNDDRRFECEDNDRTHFLTGAIGNPIFLLGWIPFKRGHDGYDDADDHCDVNEEDDEEEEDDKKRHEYDDADGTVDADDADDDLEDDDGDNEYDDDDDGDDDG